MRPIALAVNGKGVLLCVFLMGKFADQIKRWGEKAEQRIDATFRGAALEALTRIVMATPVDKGVARGSWQVSFDAPAAGHADREDQSGNLTIADGASIIGRVGSGETIYISSALSYIKPLETGHSKQGSHMVARVVSDWDGIVRKAAKNAERAYR